MLLERRHSGFGFGSIIKVSGSVCVVCGTVRC